MSVTLSAFGDEIDPSLNVQLEVLRELGVLFLEFRSAWGKNIKDLSDDDLQTARRLSQEYGIKISCLGSPIGKSPILDPLENDLGILERMFQAGSILDCRAIRIFSFYPPNHANPNEYVDEAIQRLHILTDRAAQEGFTLMLENDEELVGSSIKNMLAVLREIDSPHLRHAWDGANFVASGETKPTSDGWDDLQEYLGVVHVKDFRLADRTRRAAGEGDAETEPLFHHLVEIGYSGFLAIEPHPYHVDGRGELHGKTGMSYAVEACRRVTKQVGLLESQ